jgi:hypothetical protein
VYSYVTDDEMGRYFRRYQLGLRFLAHEARSRTTTEWCGLTRDQLATLRQRWRFDPDDRRRGPAPSSFQVFFRSKWYRSRAAVFASLCHILCARSRRGSETTARPFVGIENGEMLCEALEAYREWQPNAEMEFEYAVLLATATMEGDPIALGRCEDCCAAMLVDKNGQGQKACRRCRRGRSAQQKVDRNPVQDQEHGKAERNTHRHHERKSRTHRGDLEGNRGHNADHAKGGAQKLDDRREERQDE